MRIALTDGPSWDAFRLARRSRGVDWDGVTSSRPGIRIVELPETFVRVRVAGRGPTTLVFACDPPNVVEQYDEVIALLGSRHRIVVMEQPGFGFSFPKPSFGFARQDFARASAGLLRELHLAPYVLIAPCFSAYYAMTVAAENSDVCKLVLMQATSWRDAKVWADEVAKSFVIGATGLPFGDKIGAVPFLGQALFSMTERWFPDLTHPFAVYKSKERRAVLEKFTLPGREAFRRGACNCMPSLYQRYFAVGEDTAFPAPVQPTLILWANCDYWHDSRNVGERFGGVRGWLLHATMKDVLSDKRGLLRYAPHASFAEIDDTGHHLDLENPREVCGRIADFVAESK